jgi:hypothetical protein
MVSMSSETTVFVKSKSRASAEAWATVLRSLGMNVSRPTDSPAVSGDGRWTVRANSMDSDQRGQRHDG